jgi:hypothetical protein
MVMAEVVAALAEVEVVLATKITFLSLQETAIL